VLDPQVIDPLRALIESAPRVVGQRAALIISDQQILSARLKGLASGLLPGSSTIAVWYNIVDYELNSVTLYDRISALFPYARNETNRSPLAFPSNKSLNEALTLLGFDVSDHAELYNMASTRAERHASNNFSKIFKWGRSRLSEVAKSLGCTGG
jgi:hypothetical protein